MSSLGSSRLVLEYAGVGYASPTGTGTHHLRISEGRTILVKRIEADCSIDSWLTASAASAHDAPPFILTFMAYLSNPSRTSPLPLAPGTASASDPYCYCFKRE